MLIELENTVELKNLYIMVSIMSTCLPISILFQYSLILVPHKVIITDVKIIKGLTSSNITLKWEVHMIRLNFFFISNFNALSYNS